MYDYADYTETLLGHKSVLLFPHTVLEVAKMNPAQSSLGKFRSRFEEVVFVPLPTPTWKGDRVVFQLGTTARRQRCDMLYVIEGSF